MARPQRAGEEAVLPEMAASIVQTVDILGVNEICSADCLCKRIFIFWNGYDMDMICHKTIAEDFESEFAGIVIEEFEVKPAVIIDEKDVLTVVATLGDVVRNIGYNYSCCSWHRGMITGLI